MSDVKRVLADFIQYKVKKARRRILLVRIFSWIMVLVFVGLVVNLAINIEDSALAISLSAVSLFGIYQVVRVLKSAKAESIFLDAAQELATEIEDK